MNYNHYDEDKSVSEELKVQFFVGILPSDREQLLSDITKFGWTMENEYDDPGGYYTFVMRGTWAQYDAMKNLSYIKSIEHFEE